MYVFFPKFLWTLKYTSSSSEEIIFKISCASIKIFDQVSILTYGVTQIFSVDPFRHELSLYQSPDLCARIRKGWDLEQDTNALSSVESPQFFIANLDGFY